MDFSPEISVFLLSLTAPFILYTINHVSILQDPQVILAIGITVLTTLFLLANLSVKSRKSTDPLFYVFAVFSFTSVVGITNALQQDGFIRGFMDFYISKVEPYLSTAHCIMMSYWDGVVHYGLLLIMIHRLTAGKSFRGMALVWAGSMIASQIVFIPGIVVGKYGKNILPAFWRNAAFLVLPIWAAAKLFNRPRELPIIPADKVEVEQKKALFSRPADLLLTLGLLGTIIFTAFRGFVILECSLDSCFSYIYQYEPYMKDSVGFPKVMMLVSMFYVLPLLTACVYGLYTPGCTWMLDWTLFLAGAVAQTQWTHLGASVHSRTSFTYRIPRDEWRLVVTLNLLYAAVPVLLAVRCYLDQAFFMKNVPQEQASNGKKKS
ncbi:LOW QUALITY PROTEIN: transmembrane 6 superfamily member 2 [Megalobrama amblycephala]|uniref:LOW QUALITY PROTEIN: transmembrane 6 superfamily member 2 n=1 Tax=Megalobrama amblycephala TaxID=75352 RepID=UPI002014712D|nr:LOW QUALITY PROTEIN: transmembrane 6 superfamily member 2 [Megalobrama amblycephala]